MYYVYFLKSTRNGKMYCGSSSKHPQQRLEEHNGGSNKWTKQNGPFLLLYFEEYICQIDCKKREQFYKTGFGRKIRNAILDAVSATG